MTQLTVVDVEEIGGMTPELTIGWQEERKLVEKRTIIKKDLSIMRKCTMVNVEENEVDMMVPGVHLVSSTVLQFII